MAAALAEIGLTARMHCVLVHALEAERTQIQLAEIGDMDKTTMVVTVDALEKAGLAERRPSSTDRRARIIAVTEEGAGSPSGARRSSTACTGRRWPRCPTTKREVLVRAMNRLVTGHLATPVEAPQAARRARQRTEVDPQEIVYNKTICYGLSCCLV